MTSERSGFLFEIMALASIIVVLDIIIGGVGVALVPQSLFILVSNLLLVEFALLLIIGACMMSRQPMHKVAEETPSRSQKSYDLGKKLLGAAIFAFVFSLLFALIP
jgi:hypothetical protein